MPRLSVIPACLQEVYQEWLRKKSSTNGYPQLTTYDTNKEDKAEWTRIFRKKQAQISVRPALYSHDVIMLCCLSTTQSRYCFNTVCFLQRKRRELEESRRSAEEIEALGPPTLSPPKLNLVRCAALLRGKLAAGNTLVLLRRVLLFGRNRFVVFCFRFISQLLPAWGCTGKCP